MSKMKSFPWKRLADSKFHQSIYIFQSPHTRALNVGFIAKKHTPHFIPGRLHLGPPRSDDTYQGTLQSLTLPPIAKVLKKYSPANISTITLMRETLSCRLGDALYRIKKSPHYGDAYIGASHIKGDGAIRTAYLYENTEGLVPDGLWIIADSLCVGRNLKATMTSLLSQFRPKELLFICPLATRVGIDNIGGLIAEKDIPTTFIAWGALFGLDQKTLYDMPWGHPNTESLEARDQKLFVSMYGIKLCVGGDFGNDYYCPPLALKLYEDQLKEHMITPSFPTLSHLNKLYSKEELLKR